MRFKAPVCGIVSFAAVVWLACVALATAGSDLDDVRAKVRAKYPSVHQLSTAELAA